MARQLSHHENTLRLGVDDALSGAATLSLHHSLRAAPTTAMIGLDRLAHLAGVLADPARLWHRGGFAALMRPDYGWLLVQSLAASAVRDDDAALVTIVDDGPEGADPDPATVSAAFRRTSLLELFSHFLGDHPVMASTHSDQELDHA